MKLSTAATIEDLRHLARRRLPRVIFDNLDGGAEEEITLRANSHAFKQVMLRPRSGVGTAACDLRTTVLGTAMEVPFLFAPTGSCRLLYPRGEEVVVRAAAGAGVTCVLGSRVQGSRMSGAPQRVRCGSRHSWWAVVT
jgi:isopentenyl diphosphate isomerase/L-lactate dehydrogenase-like FMN-dependent dehydrogenase